ncbi:hypothetical protein F183_A07620 [Bryobacterales bacterium F-183]|nr:hypothetical protein F183_A07620 [Bryobacterales bacterium F-183]
MIERLSREGPVPASTFAGTITLTAVGQHLKVLEECGLVRTEKQGRVRTCRLHTAGLTVLEQWIRHHQEMWQKRLDLLQSLVEEDEGNDV